MFGTGGRAHCDNANLRLCLATAPSPNVLIVARSEPATTHCGNSLERTTNSGTMWPAGAGVDKGE